MRFRPKEKAAVALLSVTLLSHVINCHKRVYTKKSRRRFGIHPILRIRETHGIFYTVYPELRKHPDRFFKFFRMTPEIFDLLLSKVRPFLEKKSIPENSDFDDP